MKNIKFLALAFIATLAACGGGNANAAPLQISNNGITISTCDHDAGAICSLIWNGKQFIDDHDHGRQLQSAVSYDYKGENFNPTEAGASIYTDGVNPRPSSSEMTSGMVVQNHLLTTVQMAYWNPVKGVKKSDNKMSKMVSVGMPQLPNVINYRVTFTRPYEEKHTFGQYEVLTGYMPAEFSSFLTLDVKDDAWTPQYVSDGPGEQKAPIILCTSDHQYCMGVYSPLLPQTAYADAGYGRWRFVADKVVKWNAVFRFDNPSAYQTFQMYVLVGTLDQVTVQMRTLHKQLNEQRVK